MNVFLSWSGTRSHGVASAFNEWLPTVVQQLQPWISTESIGKGANWLGEIRSALEASNGVGLFFVTREALSSQWLLFEAGGIAALGHQRVCTVCVDLEARELKPPLSFFQSTKLEKSDIRKLVDELNRHLPRPVSAPILDKSFERAWPDLQEHLAIVEKAAQVEAPEAVPAAAQPAGGGLDVVLEALRRVESRLGNLEQQRSAPSLSDPLSLSESERRAFMETLARYGADDNNGRAATRYGLRTALNESFGVTPHSADGPELPLNALARLAVRTERGLLNEALEDLQQKKAAKKPKA